MTTYVSTSDIFRGTDATGSDGDSNRTIALNNSTAQLAGMVVIVDGASLHHAADYTLSGNVITFLNALWDTSYIDVNYNYTLGSGTATTATYATSLQVFDFLDLTKQVPDHVGGTHTNEEVVAAGAASTSTVYTVNARVISGTYIFTHGATEAGTQTTLTETTHYTFDKDTGAFTLTSTGVTEVGSDGVFGAYKYNTKVSDSKMQDLLNRQQSLIDNLTEAHWCDGTVATPDYLQVSEEKYNGQGQFNLAYYLNKYPIANVSTSLDGDVVADDSTITVVSTDGFPSSGSFSVGSDRIDYTGKTSTTFTGCTSVEAHDSGDVVNGWVVEISSTAEGSTPVWTVISKDTDYDLQFATGRITLLRDDLLIDTQNVLGEVPQWLVPNRFRFTGQVGFDSIPSDLTQLLITMVSLSLYSSQVLNAVSRGTNGFTSNGVTDLRNEKKRLLGEFTNAQVDNI
jgi:hypothetical protein